MSKNTLFKQLLHLIPKATFNSVSKSCGNEKYSKKFSGWNHFAVMLFTQIKGFRTTREIESATKSHEKKWYHLGMKKVPRSTLADANSRRSPEPYQHLFFKILEQCKCVSPKHKFKFSNQFYSLDASTISLCLSMFDWAKFRKRKGGVRLHTLLNHNGYIPEWLNITTAKVHESQVVKKEEYNFPKLPKGSIIAVDRGYVDYEWFSKLAEEGCFFITRAKSNMKYTVVKRREKNRRKGILFDQEIRLTGAKKDLYKGTLRLIKYRDAESGDVYVYLTNNFDLAARTIAAGYKERWQIELFFKWIKQNLKIKSFIGTSENAVMIQVWTAMIYYLLLSYLKYMNRLSHSLLEITRILREKLFENEFFVDLFDTKSPPINRHDETCNIQMEMGL